MSRPDLCFFVCQGCGPEGLFDRLAQCAGEWRGQGVSVSVRHPTCLSACRFGHVVLVQQGDGQLVRYAGADRNGFCQFHDDPFAELVERHLPEDARCEGCDCGVGARPAGKHAI